MIFRQFFERESCTYTYLLASRPGGEALLIDPVLEGVETYLQAIEELDLRLAHAVDTHVHADHITGLGTLREQTGCITVMGEQSKAACVSRTVSDGERLRIDGIEVTARYTPGHTDDSYSFLIGDRVFTGDTLLIRGTGRTDFQNGDAAAQYHSLFEVLLKLPDETLVYPAHDYRGWTVSTIGEERAYNPRLQVESVDQYRDIMDNLNLADPKMMNIAVAANLACGLPTGSMKQDAPLPDDSLPFPEIQPLDVYPKLGEYRLVDVREPDEFTGELGHVPGSELVPAAQVMDAANSWDPSTPLLMICRSGRRSGIASTQLLAAGFQSVTNLQGGMLAWHHALLPTTRHGDE